MRIHSLKTVFALTTVLSFPSWILGGEFSLSGPGVSLTFRYESDRLALIGMQGPGARALLFADQGVSQPGAGPVGNPMTVVVRDGKHKGIYGMNTFQVKQLNNTTHRLLAYLVHESMPLAMALEILVEGSVVTWMGQALWNGDEPIEIDFYYPLLSRVKLDAPERDRLLVAKTSGVELRPLGEINHSAAYLGNLSSPVLIAEGGSRGLAMVDNNRSDYADEPGACALRGNVAGNTFPVSAITYRSGQVKGGEQGPFVGIRYTRYFRPISEFGGEQSWNSAEKSAPVPIRKLGDAVDIGPIRTFAYEGNWKVGAAWLREQRSHIVFRVSPDPWYRNNTFVAEDLGDSMLGRGLSFYDYPKILAEKQRLGADLFHLPGFHDPEILGTTRNWQNRGDYTFAAQNLGGLEAVQQGIRSVHRQGGRILYYIEGLIMWKRSRIGRSLAKDWALMEPDGTYTEHYKGFWHMCPAVKEWQEWLARTAAEVVRSTDVDGFFIDSSLATYNHRCFNPAHKHPHPDVWNWGIRQMLRRLREELDKVKPNAIILVEGVGDMGREYADGFVSHGHFWNRDQFNVPLVRFLHPDMRAYESWGNSKDPQRFHIWNSVNGHRIYAHNSQSSLMAPLSLRTRRYYDAFPEITDNEMSLLDAACSGCIAQVFEGKRPVITVGNMSDNSVDATLEVPVRGTVLFDRVDSARVTVVDGKASLKLGPWEFRAFEVRQ